MLSKHALKEGYLEFINTYNWDLYITFTFRHSISPVVAIRRFKHFFKYLNNRDENVPFFKNFINCFVVVDKKDPMNVHIHALIRGINPTFASEIKKICEYDKSIGISDIQPYILKAGADEYLANKCVESEKNDYVIFTVNSRKRVKN